MSTFKNVQLSIQRHCTTLPGVAKAVDNLKELDQHAVGRRITVLRGAKNIKQATLARMIGGGMTPQKLNNYEKGRNLIPPHEVGRLCAVTGANFDYIYRGQLAALPSDLIEGIAKAEKALAAPSAKRA